MGKGGEGGSSCSSKPSLEMSAIKLSIPGVWGSYKSAGISGKMVRLGHWHGGWSGWAVVGPVCIGNPQSFNRAGDLAHGLQKGPIEISFAPLCSWVVAASCASVKRVRWVYSHQLVCDSITFFLYCCSLTDGNIFLIHSSKLNYFNFIFLPFLFVFPPLCH